MILKFYYINLSFLFFSTLVAQTTIYSEDFSNDDGKGYVDNTLTDPTDNNWTLALVGSPDVYSGDYCKVTSGYLEWKDNACGSGDAIEFTTAVISGDYTGVSVSMDYYVYDAYCSGTDANLTFYYKKDGGSWTQFDSKTSTGGSTSGSVSETNLSFSTSLQLKVRGNTPNCSSARNYIDNISITGTPNGPNITAGSISGSFSTCYGTASSERTFSVQGGQLTNDLVITAPTGYEVSASSGSGFSSSVTLTPSSGTVASTTIYARLSTSASVTTTQNIVCSSTGATSVNVATGAASITSNTLYVSTSGSNANSGVTSSVPLATIQQAIDIVSTSCGAATIYLADGTYDENDIDIDISVSIIGASESGTIIDNNDVSGEYCFKVTTVNSDVTLKNLTIRDFKGGAGCAFYSNKMDNKIIFNSVTFNSCYVNSGTSYDGVVFVYYDTGASTNDGVDFIKCTFSDNYSAEAGYGAAVTIGSYSYDYDYKVLIDSCTFDNNDGAGAYGDGVVSIDRGYSVDVKKSVFKNNTGHYYSAGLSLSSIGSSSGSTDRVNIENCLFHDNSLAFAGAALKLEYCNGDVFNCTFAQNSNTNSSSYYVSSLDIGNSTIAVKNCIFQSDDSGNEMISGGTLSYCLINGGAGGDSYTNGGNNLSSSPSFTNASGNDFTLASNSPCIDAGTDSGAPTTDLLGVTRSSTDIGCYETMAPEWTGGAGTTDWNTAGNWNIGSVPGSSQDITIPSTATDPIVTGAVSARNLTIQSGGELTVSGSGSLALSGDVTISGTMNYSSTGSITLSKSGGTLSGTGSQTGADYVLSSGASFDLSDSWSINNMNVNSGASLTVATTKTLTTATDLTNGGSLTCSGSAGLTVGGGVSLTGSTTLGSGTFDVDGDYSNSGTFTAGTSTFKLSGTSAQTVTNTNVSATIGSLNSSSDAVNETFESGLGVFSNDSGNEVDFATTTSLKKNGSYSLRNVPGNNNSNWIPTSTIDLSNFSSATLTFWHIASFEGGWDEATVWYSENNGSNWTRFPSSKYSGNPSYFGSTSTYFDEDSYSGWNSADNTDWQQATFDMDFLCGQNDIKIGFYVTTDGSTTRDGWYIDDVIINGTSSIAGAGPLTLSNEFYDIVIDNTNGIDLSTADIGYSNTMTLTNGVITTGTDDTIYIENSSASAMPSGSSSSFINGNVKFNIAQNTSTYSIHIGDGTASTDYYRVDFVNNNLQGTSFITARMTSGSPSGYNASTLDGCNINNTQGTNFQLKEIASEALLKLTPNTQPTGGNYGLKFYTANFDKNTWTDNKIAVVKRSEGSSNNCDWSIAGTLPADNATGRLKTDSYLSFTGATSFSEFGPGGEGGGALPVSLSLFNAALNSEGKVDITWTTMSEQDNDFFSVQRTADGDYFEEVEEVPGAGNSIVRIDYSAIDEEPLLGTSYYRLMQQDYDGAQTYSDMVAVNNNFIANLTSFSLFYEGNQTINLRYTLGSQAQYNLQVYDISGKLIYSDVLNLDAGTANTQINITDLSKGLYFVNLSSGQELYSQKVIVQ